MGNSIHDKSILVGTVGVGKLSCTTNYDCIILDNEPTHLELKKDKTFTISNYSREFLKLYPKDNFNHKKFIATCKKNRKLRKKKKR